MRIVEKSIIGVANGDTRSLDCSSYLSKMLQSFAASTWLQGALGAISEAATRMKQSVASSANCCFCVLLSFLNYYYYYYCYY